jgi:hypothetical protein
MKSYEILLGHIRHHNIRKWLLRGCKDEDANTIREAVSCLSDGQLQRRFARMLIKSAAEVKLAENSARRTEKGEP